MAAARRHPPQAPRPRVRAGCAGWSLPARHRHLAGDGDSGLARYASVFSTVEINSSFHRPHQAKTYARWAASVPADFRFSVKLPRTISHDSGLRGTGPALDRFLGEAGALGDRLGGFLLQLPPNLVFDAATASRFLQMFRRRSDVPLACEPRHPSWFTAAALALLERNGVARVAADPPRAGVDATPAGAGPWRYWRWHGAPRLYYSAYSEERLHALAAAIAGNAAEAEPWVIFDNTAHGHAVADAVRLLELLGQAR